jgi:thiamine biosynthesis lipoprotein ApbE
MCGPKSWPKRALDAASEKIKFATLCAAKRFLCEATNQRRDTMKKFILGTITAATVIASATAASAQTRTERAFDLSAFQAQQAHVMQDPNKNFAPDSVK